MTEKTATVGDDWNQMWLHVVNGGDNVPHLCGVGRNASMAMPCRDPSQQSRYRLQFGKMSEASTLVVHHGDAMIAVLEGVIAIDHFVISSVRSETGAAAVVTSTTGDAWLGMAGNALQDPEHAMKLLDLLDHCAGYMTDEAAEVILANTSALREKLKTELPASRPKLTLVQN